MRRIAAQRDSFAYHMAMATPDETFDNNFQGPRVQQPPLDPPPASYGPWYHSTYADLKPGDKLQPLNTNPVDQSGRQGDSLFNWHKKNPGMDNRADYIWLHNDPQQARDYADKYSRQRRNGNPQGHTYVIKPDDTPQRWNGDAYAGDGWAAKGGTVVGEIKPEALDASMKGWIHSPDWTYNETKVHSDNPGDLVPEIFPERPVKVEDWSKYKAKGYEEFTPKGWGSAYASRKSITCP